MRQALELALEALQDYVDEHGPWSDDSGAQYVLRVGKEALAQPEQEPVANVVLRDGLPTLLANNQIKPTDERLYTTPPQPEKPDQDEVDIRSRLYQRIHELETQLAQPEQEPLTGGDERRHIICLCPDCTTPPQRKPPTDAALHLSNLVEALDNAFISSWQSTHHWQKQLDDAREYLTAHGIKE